MDEVTGPEHSFGVVIPIFNEEDILEDNLSELIRDLEPYAYEYTIYAVENGSQDESRTILNNLKKELKSLKVVHLDKPDYGEALRAGIQQTKYEKNLIINMDFWDKKFIKQSLPLLEEYGLIIGTKSHPGSEDDRSSYRKLLTWGLNTLLGWLVNFEGNETHGLKALKKSSIEPFLDQIRLRRGMFDTEMVIRAQKEGVRIRELPVHLYEDRPPRNWMLKKILQNLVDIIRLTWVIRREYG